LESEYEVASFLFDCFSSHDRNVRVTACQTLVKLSDSDTLHLLIESLGHPKADVRCCVVWVLGEIGGEAAYDALGDALKDWNDGVRYVAVSVLANLGGSEAVPHLMAAMYDYDEDIRRHAANILGKMGDVRAVPALIFALKNRGGWRKSR